MNDPRNEIRLLIFTIATWFILMAIVVIAVVV